VQHGVGSLESMPPSRRRWRKTLLVLSMESLSYVNFCLVNYTPACNGYREHGLVG
jgi:hypothetical protein